MNINIVLEIRRGIVQFHNSIPECSKLYGIITTDSILRDVMIKKRDLYQEIQNSNIKLYLDTTILDVQRFFGFFDLKDEPVRLTLPYPIKSKL